MDYSGDEKGQKQKIKVAEKTGDLFCPGKKVIETPVTSCSLYLSL